MQSPGKVRPVFPRMRSLPRSNKLRIAVLLIVGIGLAVLASRVVGHLPQIGLMMAAECFGVYASQLIRNKREVMEVRPAERAQPVLYAGSLRQNFGMDDFEVIRSGLDHATFRPVTPRSELFRRATDRRW